MESTEKTFRQFTQEQGHNYATDRPPYGPALLKFIVDHHTSTGGQLTRVLDVGCGTGQATQALSHSFSSAIGLDSSKGMVDAAHASASAYASTFPGPTPSRAQFGVSAAEHLGVDLDPPIAENSVDLLTAATSAHWFNLDLFWARASRVLKRGGTVALWARTGMSIDATATPNGEAIKAAMETFYQQLLPYASSGGDMTRNLYADLPLPWKLDAPVKAFDEKSFLRRVWNKDRKYLTDSKNASFGVAMSMSPAEFERFLATHSPVARWRKAHPDLCGTKDDIVKSLTRRIKGLLRDAGVEPSEQLLRGGVAIVLIMVKKL